MHLKEIIDIIKNYIFHTIKKIPKYELLLTIPEREYDPSDELTYFYMHINEEKDYFLTYKDFEIQIQIFRYIGNVVYGLEGHSILIK